jgi:glutamine synthetase
MCLDGIRNKTEPPKPIEKNLFQLSDNEIKQRKIKSLPRNLFTALEEFEKSPAARAALGDYIFEEFLDSKRAEWNDYRKQVTTWELEKYLDV